MWYLILDVISLYLIFGVLFLFLFQFILWFRHHPLLSLSESFIAIFLWVWMLNLMINYPENNQE